MPTPRMAMPRAVDPAPPAGEAAELPVEAETDAEPLAAEPKPLCRSPTALRADGDAAAAPALLGATELAKTDCPPLLTTPAVAPWARASNSPAAAPAPAPAAGATPAPVPLPPLAPLLPRLPTAPLAPPLAPSAGAGAVEPPPTGAGVGSGLGAAGAGAG